MGWVLAVSAFAGAIAGLFAARRALRKPAPFIRPEHFG